MLRSNDWNDMENPERSERGSSFGLLGVAWRRKWIVMLLTAVAVGLGYLYFTQQTPMYQSTAQLLLIKKQRDNLPIQGVKGSTGYEETLSTHMLLITSPVIVGRAIEDHNLASLRSLQYSSSPMAVIRGSLFVARAGGRDLSDPNVIELTYEGPDARDCATILEAIISAYQDYLGETYQDFSTETVNLITEAKDVLHKQLSEKEAAYRAFQQESPLLKKGSEAMNLHEQRMQEIESARSVLLRENSKMKAEIDAIQHAIERGGNREALKLLVGENKTRPVDNTTALQRELVDLLAQEQTLLEDFGPDHPKVQAVRNKRDILREQLRPKKNDDEEDYVDIYVGSLRENLLVGERRLQELDQLFEREREAAKQLFSYQVADDTYSNDIDRLRKLFDGVIKRLEEINLVKDVGGIKTQVITPAGLGYQTKPNLLVIMTFAVLLGMMAGGGVAYLVDLSDRRFRSPDEVRRELGLPIVGHIPLIESDRKTMLANGVANERVHPMLCAYFQPKSRTSEAYRAVRTSLFFSAVGDGHKVIQVTSPHPGDGKTTMAANLAISIANSGKQVVLLETDFRRPRVHTMFGTDNSVGVTSVIAGESELPDVIRKTPVENLFAIPCGPRPQNPAELLTSPRFNELMELLREKYDFVVIDSPPLLAVTDASVVAPRVDGVILVMRLTKNARDGARRATEVLNTMGAKVLGVVVNGIGRGGSYGYGYGKGYGYGYGYGGYNYAYYNGRAGYGYHEYDESYSDTYYEEEDEVAAQASNGRSK